MSAEILPVRPANVTWCSIVSSKCETPHMNNSVSEWTELTPPFYMNAYTRARSRCSHGHGILLTVNQVRFERWIRYRVSMKQCFRSRNSLVSAKYNATVVFCPTRSTRVSQKFAQMRRIPRKCSLVAHEWISCNSASPFEPRLKRWTNYSATFLLVPEQLRLWTASRPKCSWTCGGLSAESFCHRPVI